MSKHIQRHFMIQGALGNIKPFSALLLNYTVDNGKKVSYPATRPMIVNQSIIANMPGLRVENLVHSLPILQFNKFYGYETCSISAQKKKKNNYFISPRGKFNFFRIQKAQNKHIPRGTCWWMFEFGTGIWEHDYFYSWISLQLMTPGKPLTHNMLSGASPASFLSQTSQQISLLSLSVHRACYLRRLSGCHAFSKCLVRDSLRLLSLHNWMW